jgi:hypothetical protein
MNRIWIYRDWDGPPLLHGSDEYGRRTLLLRLRHQTALVIALWRDR